MILGEGAAMLVLEPLEAALARGATPIAEIIGFGMSSDASHITQPLAEGAARAIRGALHDGGIEPEQVGYINAHGTGTEANDKMEVAAIRLVFGDACGRLPDQLDQVDAWPHDGRRGSDRSGGYGFPLEHGILAADRQLHRPRPGVRSGCHSQ